MKTSGSQFGYTLIELIYVIAVIGVLTAILFPVLTNIFGSSRKTTCASNLKQIGAAVALYKQDYDESYPRGIDFTYNFKSPIETNPVDPLTKGVPMLQTILLPYYKAPEIFHCPSDIGTSIIKGSIYQHYGSSYEVVALIYGETDACWSNSSSLVYMYDVNGAWHPQMMDYDDFRWNQLYLDGHVLYSDQASTVLAQGVYNGGCLNGTRQ